MRLNPRKDELKNIHGHLKSGDLKSALPALNPSGSVRRFVEVSDLAEAVQGVIVLLVGCK